jgi:hypothetical protein
MIDAQRTLFIFISLPAEEVAGRVEQTAKFHGKQNAKSQRKQRVTTGAKRANPALRQDIQADDVLIQARAPIGRTG